MRKTRRKPTERPANVSPAPAAGQRRRRGRLLAATAVAAVSLWLAYQPALAGPFLFDDRYLPFADPAHQNQPLTGWLAGVRPLLMLTFWLNYRLFGLEPFSYHVANLAIHLGAGLMVFLIVRRLLALEAVEGRLGETLAAFAAGLFLLHPIQTEAVSYIASRSENLSVLLAYGAWAVFLLRRGEAILWSEAAVVLALFAAAVTTKEHTAVFPALLLLTDYYFNPGFSLAGVKRNWRLYAPLAAVAAAGLAFVWRVLSQADTAGFAVEGLPWQTYFLTQCQVIWIYLRMFLLPYGQNADHDFRPVSSPADPASLVGLAALVTALVLAWRLQRRYRLASFGALVFFVLLAPTSSVVPIKDLLVERRLYLPSIGLLLILAATLARIKIPQNALTGAAAVALATCGLLTYQRNHVWASPIALWEDAVQKAPANWRAHFQLGYAYYEAQRCSDAAGEYAQAAKLNPPDVRLLVNWALAADCAGRPQEALARLEQAAAMEKSAHVYSLIGMVQGKQGRREQALEALAAAERLDPNFAMLYVYRGHVYAAAGQDAAAAGEYRRALAIDPALQVARESLLAAEGRLRQSR
jgi:tetratricopeptide (TPR) repeat protein